MPRILSRGSRPFFRPALPIARTPIEAIRASAVRAPIEASRALERHLTEALAPPAIAPPAPALATGGKMSLEIKGLADAVKDAKARIAEARKGVVDLHQSSQALVATIAEAKRQIDQHHDDLRFDLTTLGNGSPES